MKRSNTENIIVSRMIDKGMNFKFKDIEYQLDDWGDIDNHSWINESLLLLLECEKSQKHPTTNVLKVWPYLDKYSEIQVIFIHYFFQENKAPKNRIRLCEFLANNLEITFGNRFKYFQVNDENINELVTVIKKSID